MKPLSYRSPHVERLTGRLRSLDGPLIQLWGWPGAGQQAVLDALTEDARFGQPLSLDDLSDEASLSRAVEAAVEGGARWLVLPSVPSLPAASPESAGTIARLLVPGQRLVFAAPRRRDEGPLSTSLVLPEELLLDAEELAELWRRVTGSEPGAPLVDRLLAATDGWYRPLRLAAEEAAEAGGSVDVATLHRLPAVASFLRHEVLGLLDRDEAELLVTLAAGDGLRRELWRSVLDDGEEELRRRLVEDWGLAVEGAAGPRLPTLLAAFLDRERAAWSAARRHHLAARLGRAELAAGRPVRALAHFAAARPAGAVPDATVGQGAGEPSADRVGEWVDEVLAGAWLPLFAGADMGTLDALFSGGAAAGEESAAAGGVSPTPSAALLSRLTGILHWRRDTDLIHLRALYRTLPPPGSGGEGGELALAARMALEILGAGGGLGEGHPARVPWSAVPPELRPLRVLAELGEETAPAAEDDAEEGGSSADDAAAATLLVPALERVEPERRPAGLAVAAGETGAASASLLQALFERGVLHLLRRRPALSAELSRRRDLPEVWRRWLAGLPPAALASESFGYSVQLLGKPDVRLRRPGGRSVELRFPLRRAFQVFAYLVTSPGFEATRDELVEAVWWDEGEAAVEKNFHPTISYVRRALRAGGDGNGVDGGGGEADADPLQLRAGAYRLNPRLAWNVDVAEMTRRVEQGRRRLREGQPEQAVALLQSAWGLYRGPLLAGWDAPWITTRRDELATVHQETLAALGEVCERLDRLTEAMDACRAALLEDPLQERIHLALMRIYARQGRRDLVRRQYERLSALLSEELALEPMAETTDAYHRLMS